MKKKIRLFIVVLFVASIGLGMVLLQSDKTQLQLQVGATNHIGKLLPMLPQELIDQRIVTEYGDVLEKVLQHTDLKVVSHIKKTNNTGVATIEVVVPVVCRQVSNALLTSSNTAVQEALAQVNESKDIDIEWLLNQITHEIHGIDFSIAKTKTLTLEVPTYAIKNQVWSFSKDALQEMIFEVYRGMGFNDKWREELLKAIP